MGIKINWINKKGIAQGIFWTILSTFLNNLCDVSIRLIGTRINPLQITFFRLLFGTLLLMPFMLHLKKTAFTVGNKPLQLLRIIIGYGAISLWVYGASQTTLPSITTISFICPILILPLSYIFLKEKSDWKKIIAVFLGFLGVVIIAFFEKTNNIAKISYLAFFHSGILFLFLGAILFSLSDILNKKMMTSENIFSMLFYFYAGTLIISFIPALIVWQPFSSKDLGYLLILGIGGVLVLYCILKAVKVTELSSLVPYKYIELIFSIIIGYMLFGELIKTHTIIGASLIIPTALLIAYNDINRSKCNTI